MATDFADIAGLEDPEVQETFKRGYVKSVDAINDSNVLTAQMGRTEKYEPSPGGIYFYPKLETGGSVANVHDGGDMPTASRPRGKQGRVDLVSTYTTILVGGQSILLTKSTRNAHVSNLESQLTDGVFRTKIDVERQYNSDGRGILCVVETISGAPTYGVHKNAGYDNAGAGTMSLMEGMIIAFVNPSGGAERGRTVIAEGGVNADDDEMTTTTTVGGVQIGDYVVRVNTVASSGENKATNYLLEANGIKGWVKRGDTFEGISGGDFSRWNGIDMSNSGTLRRISQRLIATLEQRIYAASGKMPTFHYTTPGLVIDMQDQLAGQMRYDGQQTTLKAGYPALMLGTRKVAVGSMCLKGHWFALHMEDSVGMLDLVKPGYIDADGAKLHRVEGKHAYRADLYYPHNAIVFRRNAQGCISDLEDDNTIVR